MLQRKSSNFVPCQSCIVCNNPEATLPKMRHCMLLDGGPNRKKPIVIRLCYGYNYRQINLEQDYPSGYSRALQNTHKTLLYYAEMLTFAVFHNANTHTVNQKKRSIIDNVLQNCHAAEAVKGKKTTFRKSQPLLEC